MKIFTASSVVALASADTDKHNGQARIQMSVDDLGVPRYYAEGTDRVKDDSEVEVFFLLSLN